MSDQKSIPDLRGLAEPIDVADTPYLARVTTGMAVYIRGSWERLHFWGVRPMPGEIAHFLGTMEYLIKHVLASPRPDDLGQAEAIERLNVCRDELRELLDEEQSS